MAQKSLQAAGGALSLESLTNLESNMDDLYASYGVAVGNPWAVKRFVDGTNGSDTNDGLTPATSFATIQAGINASAQGDQVYIRCKEGDSASGDTDPDSYAETLTITGKDGLQLIGVGRGLAQGGQPQVRIGAGSTAMVTVNSFGVGIHNLTFNGAGSTGGGIKLVANGSTADAGGAVISGCHFKNCKGSGAAATGGAIYWTTYGGCWYVSIYNNEFVDNRAGICMLGTGGSIPQHVKIVGNRFGTDPNTDCDADIYVAADGIKNLFIDNNVFATVDVPAYASTPTAARYVSLGAGTTGIISRSFLACVGDPQGTEKTVGASGTAMIVPTTVRVSAIWGEGLAGTATAALIGRT